MTLSDLSIRRPVFAWMCMAALIVFGMIGYKGMGISQLPDVEFPTISVSMTWPGAAPEVMESQVVDVLEQAVMSLEGVKEISSSVSQGAASLTIELDIGRNIDTAVQQVQTKILQAQRLLPKDIDPPIVTKANPAQQPTIWLTLHGDKPPRFLMEYVQDRLQDQFTSVAGVGDVSLGGFVAPNLRIWVDADKLAVNELTVEDITNAVKTQHLEIPAGRIETPTIEQAVRGMGEARTVDDFANIAIVKRGGAPIYAPIYLKDVAVIEDGLDDIRRISRTDGKPSIGLGIRKQVGTNEVEMANGIFKRLEQVRKNLPEGLKLDPTIDRSKFIKESIDELVFTLILSAIVTSLVCWFFLGSLSATFNILLAIPTSIIGTFIVTYFFGFTLNTFTILGLSLAIGIVVDDAIMVLENIVRYREMGKNKVDAAREGANQITFAALAATLAIIAIFLPVAFMTGIIGKFFFQFGVTISVAVALSLLEALMLTPMRCAQFLQTTERATALGRRIESWFRDLSVTYQQGIDWTLKNKSKVMFGAGAFFILSLGSIFLLRKEFLPSQDQSMFLCSLQTPVGSSIDFTNETFKEVEKFVMGRGEVLHYFVAVGGFGGGQVNKGNMFITLKKPKDRPVDPVFKHRLSQTEIMNVFRKEIKKIPNVKIFVQDLSLSGFSAKRGFPIELSIQGPDWEKLWEYAQRIRDEMGKNKFLVDVDTDYLEGAKEIQVIPDRISAANHGVSIESINNTINALIGGEQIAKYSHNDKRYDIKVRLLPQQRMKADDILNQYVWNDHGERVQLKEVAKLVEKPAAINITRRARQRAITVFANIAPGQSQADAITAAGRIAKSVLPDGYLAVFTGSTQAFKESNKSLAGVFILGLIVAYMVLASQFNSYVHPLTVLMALPFSVSGALIALLMTGQSLNLYSMIGLILLMGIVKKNSILLVDFTNQKRQEGLNVDEALIKACPVRLRPILMTSFATIAAALPPALAFGPGAEVRIPMSIAVIGGVIVSTFFTLFVVPCVYSYFAKMERHSTT